MEMAAVSSVCRSPLTSIVKCQCPNPNRNRNVDHQPYKLKKNIQSVATAPALKSTRSTRLRLSQFEAAASLRCTSNLNSNSNSEVSSVSYGTKKAFISVSNKVDLAFLGSGLHNLGYTVVSTGGTALHLENNGVPVMRVEHLTSFPELFSGGVKTMQSSSMGAGTLGKKDSEHHMESLKNFKIFTFDVVVVNFNPFYEKIPLSGGVGYDDEGPELIHALGSYTLFLLAKNYKEVLVVVDPQDYRSLLEYLKGEQDDDQFHHKLAKKAIQHDIMCSLARHNERRMKDYIRD